MKTLKYMMSLLLSLIVSLLPIIAILFYIMVMNNNKGLAIAIIMACIGLLLNKPMQALRIKYRREVEYDEFGRSKTKGSYDKLSKQERDFIDYQKVLEMETIVDSTALKKMTKKGSKDPSSDMEKLVGLVPIKQKMKEMVARMEFETSDKLKKKSELSFSGRHMVFYGSPGTGKTTVARIFTGFLYKYGYIKENKCIEVDGNYLKAGSDTAIKTELVIRQAYNGVLFIDEAYALMHSGDGSGEQAIATLIKRMEDDRGKFILILAGYTNEMKQLLKSNSGFESRIKEHLVFPDYNDIEMREIFQIMAAEQNFVIDWEAYDAFDERISKERKLRSFGNGRTVRNILDETIDKHALNFVNGILREDQKYKICGCDVSRNVKQIGI